MSQPDPSPFALLARESSNRVFGTFAPELLAAEIAAIGPHFSNGLTNIEVAEIGGLPCVKFDLDVANEGDVFLASNLALGRGLFGVRPDGALYPLAYRPLEFFDTDLITIQRYAGKTNEQFTHLLVNLALAESKSAHRRAEAGESVRLLDPVAGRGSTLNRGLTYGFDVAGVEVEESSVDQYRQFLSTYLKDHRIKHKLSSERIRKGEHSGASAFEIAINPALESGRQHVRMVRASTSSAVGLLPSKYFDVVVGDLPYGLAHRAKSQSADRSPEQLVGDSLSGWWSLMTPGASMGLSWNVKTMPRKRLVDLLEAAELDVVEHPRSLEHRVDRQIVRDLIVAVKR